MVLSIPAFHVSDTSSVDGDGQVVVASRKDATTSHGTFDVKISVHFLPADPYPTGNVSMQVSLTDGLNGAYRSTLIELINSYGVVNPTVYMAGRCTVDPGPGVKAPLGLRFWLMIVQNKAKDEAGTPDIVGFAVHDHTGKRVAYGTGPVRGQGAFTVKAE